MVQNKTQECINKKTTKSLIFYQYLIFSIITALSALTHDMFQAQLGGGVAIALNQYFGDFLSNVLSSREIEKIEEKIKLLQERVESVRSNIDEKFIKKDELRYLLKKTWMSLFDEYRDEKIEAFVNMLVNFSTLKYSDKHNKDFYIKILDDLTPDHLLILNKAKDYVEKDKKHTVHEKAKSLEEYLVKELTRKGLDEGLVRGLLADLRSRGLMNRSQSSVFGGDIVSLYLTDLGRSILELVRLS